MVFTTKEIDIYPLVCVTQATVEILLRHLFRTERLIY